MEIRDMLHTHPMLEIRKIKRGCNQVTHSQAQLGMREFAGVLSESINHRIPLKNMLVVASATISAALPLKLKTHKVHDEAMLTNECVVPSIFPELKELKTRKKCI